MDAVLSDTLKANLKAAKTADAKLDAVVLATIANVDCQRKTGDRVKWLIKAFWVLSAAVVSLTAVGPDGLKAILSVWR
jgi:hypothetical protein